MKTAEKETKRRQRGQDFKMRRLRKRVVKESFGGMGAEAEIIKRRKKRSAYKADKRIRL